MNRYVTESLAVDELIHEDPAYDARMRGLSMRRLFEHGAPA
jgi:hypothetical protein